MESTALVFGTSGGFGGQVALGDEGPTGPVLGLHGFQPALGTGARCCTLTATPTALTCPRFGTGYRLFRKRLWMR